MRLRENRTSALNHLADFDNLTQCLSSSRTVNGNPSRVKFTTRSYGGIQGHPHQQHVFSQNLSQNPRALQITVHFK